MLEICHWEMEMLILKNISKNKKYLVSIQSWMDKKLVRLKRSYFKKKKELKKINRKREK